MAEKGQGLFLGGTEITALQNNKFVFANPFTEVVGPAYSYRTDPYASFLKLAIPGSTFTGLITDGFDDVHADIAGTGTNIQYALTGSASEVNLDTDVKFGTEGYGTSVFTQDAGQWGTASETELSWGSDNFVIEGYVYMDERFTKPPYWKVALRHTNYNIDADFGNPAAGTTDMRMRLILDTTETGQTQYFSSDFSYNLNQWYHIAWVRSGDTLNMYFDGTRRFSNTPSIGSIDTNGSYHRIMRGENATNDGAAGSWQDYRVYIGTDKGYTGATINVPASIVETTEEVPITDGLIMYLDAKDYTSGTTWTDQSGTGNDASLENTPTHTSGDSGYFQLNGSNQLVRIPIGLPSNYTIQIITQSTIGTKSATTLMSCVNDGATTSSTPKRDMKWDTTPVSSYAYVTTPDRVNLASTYNLNQWYNFTLTETGGTQQGYTDNTQTITNRTSMGTTGENQDIIIGGGYFGYSDMRVAAVLMYDRELSSAEVVENYNTFSTRY